MQTTASGAAREVPDGPLPRLDDEEGRLRAVQEYDVLDSPADPQFDDLAAVAAHLLGTSDAAVSIVAAERVWFKAAVRGQGVDTPRSLSLCARVVEAGGPLVIGDARVDPRWADHPFVAAPGGLRFFAGVPLVTAEGHAVGALSVWDRKPRVLSAQALAGLQRLAGQAVALLELRRRTHELERDRSLLALTGHVLGLVTTGAELPVVLDAVARGVEETAQGSRCSVLLLEAGHLRDGAGPTLPAAYRQAVDGVRAEAGVGACGTAAATGRLVVTRDIARDPYWVGLRHLVLPWGLRSCWSMPARAVDGEVLGTLALYHAAPTEPTAEDLQMLERWAALVAVAIERTRAQRELRRMAAHDPLTGLPNRSLVLDRLAGELRRPEREAVALLLVDLDRFALLNDSRGHHVGDVYLRAAADRLRGAVREQDVPARVGADEFVVLCPGLRDVADAERVARRVVRALAQPLDLLGETVSLSASAGVAVAQPADAVGAVDLLRSAGAAMQVAKRAGGNRFAHAGAGHDGTSDRLDLEMELRSALREGQVRCAYQPKVGLRDGRLVGVEALARWTSPTRGSVPPEEFIDVAESSDLILELGERVLRSACEQLVSWRGEDPGLADVVMWVNVAPRQLSGTDLVEIVTRALALSGLPGDRLGLEVTESGLAADLPTARRALDELRALGVRVAVDDFGTGFSSLAQLKRLPVDVLKIDRTFVDGLGVDPDDTAIVSAVVGLAHALGLTVVAEGVETERQREALLALGCEVAQGWLFSPAQEGSTRPRLGWA